MSQIDTKEGIFLYNTPEKIVEFTNKISVTRSKKPIPIILLGALMAGLFVAVGASSSSAAVYGITNTGLAKCLCGAIFPIGLILIVLLGGELFTGSTMMIMSSMKKQVKWHKMFSLLGLIFIGNFIGALIVVLFVTNTGQYNYDAGALGAYTIKVAVSKTSLSWGTVFASGIMCNTIVCLGILMATSAKSVIGKVSVCFFSIWVFVIGGYEHCVANMYYLPAGMVAASNPDYVAKAIDLYGVSADGIANLNVGTMFLNSLIPATLGNMVGGMIIVSIPMFLLYSFRKKPTI